MLLGCLNVATVSDAVRHEGLPKETLCHESFRVVADSRSGKADARLEVAVKYIHRFSDVLIFP